MVRSRSALMPDIPVSSPANPLAAPSAGPPGGSSVNRCAACGTELAGAYCHACGERALRPDGESLWRFAKDQFHEVTSADGRLWRTVKALVAPGKLTEEYLDGRRSLYVRPIRIFLVINVLIFFALSGSPGTILKGPLQSHFGAALYGGAAQTLAGAKADQWDAARRKLMASDDPEAAEQATKIVDYEAAFNTQAQALAPSLIGVLIPGFALLLAVFLWPARASGVRHLVFATHLVAAIIAASIVLILALELALGVVRAVWNSPLWADSMDPILTPLATLTFVVYIGAAVRRVYRVPVWASAVTGVLLGTLGFAFVFWCFRLVLFGVTLWTLDVPT